MQENQFEIIRKLKQKSLERCKERVISARTSSRMGECGKNEPPAPEAGFLKRWKSHHGL